MIVTCENCSSRFVVDPQVLQPRGRRVRCARCKTIWFQAPPDAAALSGDADMRKSGDGVERKQVFQRSPQPQETPPQAFASTQAASQEAAPSAETADAPSAQEPPTEEQVSLEQATSNVSDGDNASDDDMDALYGDDPSGVAGGEADQDLEDLPWDKQRQTRKSQVPALYKARSPIYKVAGWAALAALILSAAGSVIFARDAIVEKVPAAKQFYAAVGLDVERKVITQNVAAYLNIETPPPQPAYWRDDQLIQEIKGTIVNITDAPVRVPTLEGILRDRDNNELYRWLFSADADILYPGQRAEFATEIIDLPQEAAEMELVFAEEGSDAPLAGAQSQKSSLIENSR